MSYPCHRRPSCVHDEPAPPVKLREPDSVWEPAPHIVWKIINKNNIQLVSGMTPRACSGCLREIAVRDLIRYRGRILCPACFASESGRVRAEANIRLSRKLADRAIDYMERQRAAS